MKADEFDDEFDREKLEHAADLLCKIHEDTEDGYIIFAIIRADDAGLLDALIEYVEKNNPSDSQLDDWLYRNLPPVEDEPDEDYVEEEDEDEE